MIRCFTSASCAVLMICLLGATGDARANACGNVTRDGVCLDAQTLVWCTHDGDLKEVVCADGEVCVSAHANFAGGAGCIGRSFTECGSLPEEGECLDTRTVVFCDGQRQRQRTCHAGSVCAWVPDEGWYDCVPENMLPGGPADAGSSDATSGHGSDASAGADTSGGDAAVAPGDAATTVDAAGTNAPETQLQSPAPEVEKGGAGPASDAVAGGGGGGCGAGGLGGHGALWIGALALAWAAIRRSGDAARPSIG